jgi:DNA-binding transcriptional LysR family regulator
LSTVQSNVSQRIHHLEEFLHVRLFRRLYRGVVPTAEGDALYERAKQLIATLDETEKAIRPDPDA